MSVKRFTIFPFSVNCATPLPMTTTFQGIYAIFFVVFVVFFFSSEFFSFIPTFVFLHAHRFFDLVADVIYTVSMSFQSSRVESTFMAALGTVWQKFHSFRPLLFIFNWIVMPGQFVSVIQANSKRFQSSFRVVSQQYPKRFRAFSEQFFRKFSEQFQGRFRVVSEQFQSSFRKVSEQFQSNFRAISE